MMRPCQYIESADRPEMESYPVGPIMLKIDELIVGNQTLMSKMDWVQDAILSLQHNAKDQTVSTQVPSILASRSRPPPLHASLPVVTRLARQIPTNYDIRGAGVGSRHYSEPFTPSTPNTAFIDAIPDHFADSGAGEGSQDDLDGSSSVPIFESAGSKEDDSKDVHRHRCTLLPANWPRCLKARIDPIPEAEEAQGASELTKTAKSMSVVSHPHRSDSGLMRSFEIDRSGSYVAGFAGRRWRRRVLEPNSNIVILIDVMCVLALCYDIAATPYVMAWDLPYTGFVRVCGWCTTLFWTLDLLLGFRTAVFINGVLETNGSAIARHYLKTSFCLNATIVLCDWCSLILILVADGTSSIILLRISKVTRFMRLPRFLRLMRVPVWVEKLTDAKEFRTGGLILFEVAKVLFLVLTFNHLQSCVFYSIGAYGSSDTGLRWLDLEEVGVLSYSDSGHLYQYLTSFHWSLCQMTPGSMQVNAVSSLERAFTIACLVFGLLFFSSLISSLSSKMTNYQAAQRDRTAKLMILKRFLRQFKISSQLAVSVQKQAAAELSTGYRLTAKDVPALLVVGMSLRQDLAYEMFKLSLLKHPLFLLWSQVNLPAVKKVCLDGVELRYILPGITVFAVGSRADKAFRLRHGKFNYWNHLEGEHISQSQLQVEGPADERWAAEAALFCDWMHVGTLEAADNCEVISVRAELVATTMDEGVMRQVRREYARMYHSRLISACPPRAPWPTDLTASFTSYEEIVASMRREVRAFIGMVAMQEVVKKAWLWERSNLIELEREVRDGSCTLTQTFPHEVQRVVSVTVLQLTSSDGRVLTELGKYKEGVGVVVDVKLSGSKQQDGEAPVQALQRILDRKEPMLKDSVMVNGYSVEVMWKESTKYKLPTKYVRTVFHGTMEAAAIPSDCLATLTMPSTAQTKPPYSIYLNGNAPRERPPHHTPSRRRQSISSSAVRRGLVGDEDGLVFHAWLPEAEMLRLLTSDAAAEEVFQWLECVQLPIVTDMSPLPQEPPPSQEIQSERSEINVSL